MGKKKTNKTLESVLQISRALDGRFQQAVIEQVLKSFNGDTNACISCLQSMLLDRQSPNADECEMASALLLLREQLGGADFDDVIARHILEETHMNIDRAVAKMLDLILDCSESAVPAVAPRQTFAEALKGNSPSKEEPTKSTTNPTDDAKYLFCNMFNELISIEDLENIWQDHTTPQQLSPKNNSSCKSTTSDKSFLSNEDQLNESINCAISAAVAYLESNSTTEVVSMCDEACDQEQEVIVELPVLTEEEWLYFERILDTIGEAAEAKSSFAIESTPYIPNRSAGQSVSARDAATAMVQAVFQDDFGVCTLSKKRVNDALSRFQWDPEAAINYLAAPHDTFEEENTCTSGAVVNTYSYASRLRNGVAWSNRTSGSVSSDIYTQIGGPQQSRYSCHNNTVHPSNPTAVFDLMTYMQIDDTTISRMQSGPPVRKAYNYNNNNSSSTAPSATTIDTGLQIKIPLSKESLLNDKEEGDWKTVSKTKSSPTRSHSSTPGIPGLEIARAAGAVGGLGSLREQELRWRSMAQREGHQMNTEYRTAAALHHGRHEALAGHASSRGQFFKERMLKCGSMAAKCALEVLNPHIRVSVGYSGRIEYQGAVDSPRHIATSTGSDKNAAGGKSSKGYREDTSKPFRHVVIDLHGLFVREALDFLASVLDYYYGRSTSPNVILRLIVGRGVHSDGGIQKLGPAIKKYLDYERVSNSLTEGELTVRIE